MQNPYSLQPWMELASQWQRAMQGWVAWWTRGVGVARPARARVTAQPARAPYDPVALARLHEAYKARFGELWAAALRALAAHDNAMPQVVPEPQGDRRFASAAWREQPYYAWVKQAYLLYREYLLAMAALAQLAPDEKHRLEFAVRQFVDAIAPTNFPATNPDVLSRAIETEGTSIVEGLKNLADDLGKGRITMSDETAFEVGRNLAVTPGSVVLRNPLIELIQYDATTARVAKRPLVIVPPCINKFYILDLTPANSFVRYAVAAGHTVFIISWRNIPPDLGHLTWDDYLRQGVLTSLEAACSITGSAEANTLGFCVGGTLLACTLAVLAARGSNTVASATFLTTMLDFTDPGEIGVYVSDEALTAREPALCGGQRVHGSELAGAFASLRPNDLVWNYVVNNYLKGRTPPAFDLLYWNGDSASLPGPMYAYYLKNLYLKNKLREPCALTMLGETIDLSRITCPTYIYASRDDHIVPWRSAFRTRDFVGGEATFVLGASGHIAGVINPPESGRRNYWTNDRGTHPDDWLAGAASHPGSWWPHWYRWLANHAGGERVAADAAGDAHHPPLAPAPGMYVTEQN